MAKAKWGQWGPGAQKVKCSCDELPKDCFFLDHGYGYFELYGPEDSYANDGDGRMDLMDRGTNAWDISFCPWCGEELKSSELLKEFLEEKGE